MSTPEDYVASIDLFDFSFFFKATAISFCIHQVACQREVQSIRTTHNLIVIVVQLII